MGVTRNIKEPVYQGELCRVNLETHIVYTDKLARCKGILAKLTQ